MCVYLCVVKVTVSKNKGIFGTIEKISIINQNKVKWVLELNANYLHYYKEKKGLHTYKIILNSTQLRQILVDS